MVAVVVAMVVADTGKFFIFPQKGPSASAGGPCAFGAI
jgi:hypothetical protein